MNNYRVRCAAPCDILAPMLKLTRHEQKVLSAVLLLIFLGLAVKVYRTANPPEVPAAKAAR